MENVVIVSAVRTAIGSFGGSLSGIAAPQLGSIVMREALVRANLAPHLLDDVIFGHVLQAGLGQHPARQSAIAAGIPADVPAVTINKLCGSGLHSVTLAWQGILSGSAKAILAGGMENMSAAPYLLDHQARWGYRMGDSQVVDVILRDGLHCAIHGYHMGITAENIAEKYHISREEQDQVALASQQKALTAMAGGAFNQEIVAVKVKHKKQEIEFAIDEYPKADTSLAALAKLRPAFKAGGSVTAGNASGINDGAAALIVMAESQAKALGLPILARIRAAAAAGVAPELMGLGPIPASQKALKQAGLTIADIDLVEANEAFAAQFIAVGRELNFDPDKTNIYGGAIALGHPIGCSGARILVTLLHALKAKDKTLGLATLCIGGGMGSTVIVERV